MKIVLPSVNFTYFIEPEDPDYNDYKSRLLTAGHAISTINENATKTFIRSLKLANLWTKMVMIAPFIGASLTHAYVPLKSPAGNFTTQVPATSTPTFDNTRGVIFTNAADGVLTGVNPSTTFPNSSNLGVWVYMSSSIASAFIIPIGIAGGVSIELVIFSSSSIPTWTGYTTTVSGTAPTTKKGLYGGVNTTGVQTIYHDGVSRGSGTGSPTALTSDNIVIGKRGNNNTIAHPVFDLGFVAATQGLNSTEVTAFNTAVNTYMTALGR
jgi:hypothetical protein